MAEQRKSLGAEYWRSVVEEWKASGLTQRDYCRRHEVPVTTFSYWVKVLVKGYRAGKKPAAKKRSGPSPFVPVEVVRRSRPAEDLSGLEVRLPSGRSIRIQGEFEDQVLLRVVRLLEG